MLVPTFQANRRDSQWEDPAVDMQHLGLTEEDSVLCITRCAIAVFRYLCIAY